MRVSWCLLGLTLWSAQECWAQRELLVVHGEAKGDRFGSSVDGVGDVGRQIIGFPALIIRLGNHAR